jgi:CheY-like chemotaxis protein
MSREHHRNRPYDILIVEDSADDVELFLRTLNKVQVDMDMEINTHHVADGVGAIATIQKRKYDAAFLDVNMPPPDGVELTKQIRSSDMNRTTTIVILTGAEDRGLMSRAFQAGANLFLFKPIERTRLLRTIQISSGPIDRERRRLQRVKVKCRVSIESGPDRLDGETVDLSLNGMLVRATRTLGVGTVVNVALTPPSATEPIRTSARIVRTEGNELIALQLEGTGKIETKRLGEFLVPLIVAVTQGDVLG